MTVQETLKWIAELFDESLERISPETPRDAVPEWDSLGVLTLMADMDEKFGIVLTDDELQAMTKVEDIIQVLRKNGKLSN
jgi:acyl carrier protein